jgi:formate hydrogenlyase subunit 3/multisubunit Na+/H+ antiporter MnhD subunit
VAGDSLLPALPLVLPLSGALLGVASATATGLLAALLLLLTLALTCTWLGLCLSSVPPRRPCTPQHVPDRSDCARSEPPQAPALRVALLLFSAPPGTVGFVAQAWVVLAAFASLRGLCLLYVALWLLSQLQSLLSLRCPPYPPCLGTASPRSPLLSAGIALVLASALACFCARPLLELGHTWSLDFLSHTRHESGPPDPGLLARR